MRLHACKLLCKKLDAIMQVQQQTTMQQNERNDRYLNLLKKAGLTVDHMAEKISRMGIGTPQQWRHTLTTGEAGHFSQSDQKKAEGLFQDNPQLVEQIQTVIRGE